MLWQIGVASALGNYAFQVVFTGEPEQSFTLSLDVVAIEKAFTSLRHYPAKPKFAVNEGQITSVLAISESPHLLFIIRPCVLVPQDVECIEDRLSTTKKQVLERGLAIGIEADDFSIENAAPSLQITRQSFAQTQKRREYVSIARNETDNVAIRIK
jgi:hypothetical protein